MKKNTAILAGVFLLMLLAGATGEKATPGQVTPQVPGAPANASIRANMDFGRVPLYFIPNLGQLDSRVAFYIQGRDKTVYFTPGGVTFSLSQPETRTAQSGGKESVDRHPIKENTPSNSWVVKLDFVGANGDVKPVGEEKTGGVVSYFKGKPADWQAGLPTYSRIVYRDLWPGIDLAYSGTANRLKYEFIVHPGADPSLVRLAYRGIDGIAVDQEGRLEVKTPEGGFKDDIPVAYQEIGRARKNVSLSYNLGAQDCSGEKTPLEKDAEGDAWVYGFEVGNYDPTQPLILDPALFVFAGFIGGASNDQGYSIAIDSARNVYVTGLAYSTESTFPETTGPDLTQNGDFDAFVAKVDASGAGLVYCGYIGGAAWDDGRGIAVDTSGNAYVTGRTLSTQTSFPVVAGYDMTHNGLYDAFVAKVNTAGDALVYCSYVGGSADDIGTGIAVDGSGNAYIAGYTGSSEATFPEITGPDLSYNGATYDGFVCKLNSSGSGRYYCGYIGGSSDDQVNAIAVDGSGNAFVTGGTQSTQATFPVIVGPYLTHYNAQDAFVAKVNSSGTALAYCGYIGGEQMDTGYGIAVDSKGSAYIAGDGGAGAGFPFVGGLDSTYGGYGDAFVAKVTPIGDALVYCGLIGGDNVDHAFGIAVDGSGNAYVTGQTQSNLAGGFPLVDGPDLTLNGMDAFIARVNASGSKLSYCGYIGGDGWDLGQRVAVDAWGNAYVIGYSDVGTGFPVAVGPDLSHNGNYDAFVAKIYHYWTPGPKTTAVGDFDGDGTDELVVDLGTNGAWMYNSGTWTQLSAMNPQGMITANVDGNTDDELLMEFGYTGLWLYDNGAMNLLSEEDTQTMAAGDVDADGSDEVAVDFGTVGFWLYDGGSWTQLSGANLDTMVVAELNGSGGAEIVGDFGAIGLWELSSGSWTQLSGVNVENMAAGNTDGTGGKELVGDFGPVGLWVLSAGNWTQLSGVNADYMITADLDHSNDDEIIGDFSGTGLWLWDSGSWNILSGVDAELVVGADTDGDGAKELAVDFVVLGVWLYDGGSWNQISGVDPENLTAGDIDGDNAEEIIADFGTLGLWLWNGGVWSQISAINPD
ncbi:MAG: hypothetical protein A2W03_04680 [Candidatus Aminicenantes bacterium RBG_16_63_16]|nr:MAG: hypothetical protein A2W03_04680 [Candidatus Aminicenantes bacterium RBG_16_63_16]